MVTQEERDREEERKRRRREVEEERRQQLAAQGKLTRATERTPDIEGGRRELEAREKRLSTAGREGQIQPQRTVAEVRQAQQQAAFTLEGEGAFEDVTPRRTDLAPELESDIPVVTPAVAALSQISTDQSILGIAREQGLFPKLIPEQQTGESAFPVPDTPETLREAALREISRVSFNRGVSRAEKFGTMVESIPVLGKAARTFAGGLIEQPSDNIKNVVNNINRIKEDASTGQEKVRNGLEDPEFGLTNARAMEEEVAKLEGRLKLLISTSPILQANTDEVNLLQEQIFEAREKINRYRTASEFGLTAKLTQTGRVIPTDEQLFTELKRLKGG